jgi:hypothetical protein
MGLYGVAAATAHHAQAKIRQLRVKAVADSALVNSIAVTAGSAKPSVFVRLSLKGAYSYRWKDSLGMMNEWRCTECKKLLGKIEAGRLHIEFARGHKYIVDLPAVALCRGCNCLNEWNMCNDSKIKAKSVNENR